MPAGGHGQEAYAPKNGGQETTAPWRDRLSGYADATRESLLVTCTRLDAEAGA